MNDIEKVESPLLKSLLQSWTISEEEVDVGAVELTGMSKVCLLCKCVYASVAVVICTYMCCFGVCWCCCYTHIHQHICQTKKPTHHTLNIT